MHRSHVSLRHPRCTALAMYGNNTNGLRCPCWMSLVCQGVQLQEDEQAKATDDKYESLSSCLEPPHL